MSFLLAAVIALLVILITGVVVIGGSTLIALLQIAWEPIPTKELLSLVLFFVMAWAAVTGLLWGVFNAS